METVQIVINSQDRLVPKVRIQPNLLEFHVHKMAPYTAQHPMERKFVKHCNAPPHYKHRGVPTDEGGE